MPSLSLLIQPTSKTIVPSRGGLITELTSRLIAAGCDDREAITLVRAALARERIERAGGNICHAAAQAGFHRNRYADLLKKFGLGELPATIRKQKGTQLPLWRKGPGRESGRESPGRSELRGGRSVA